MSRNERRDVAGSTPVLFNIAGMLRDPELLSLFRYRVYVDLDPAFTQVWQASGEADMGFADHHRFVTVGSSIGTDECVVPTCGIDWQIIRPAVYRPMWRPARRTRHPAVTTDGSWRCYGAQE